MKVLILAILFLTIIVSALKQKKWYLCLFFAFYSILPEEFAIELSGSLPLLSGYRMLILGVLIVWLYKKKGNYSIEIPNTMLFFVIANFIISIINLRFGFGEINRIFNLIFEQMTVVLFVYGLVDSEKVFYDCIDYLMYGSTALSIIGIFQTVFRLDVTTVLNIVQSRTDEMLTERMNMVRAFGTSNAIAFGCYCAFIIPIVLYMYETKKQSKYIVILGMHVCALMCTMTRSALLDICIVVFIMLIVRNRKFIKEYVKFLPVVFIGILVVCFMYPSLLINIVEVIKSSLNVLGANFELSKDFGLNAGNASYSRTVQWTSVYYMINEGEFLFGYGYNAFVRGCLHYLYKQFGYWITAETLDVGFVKVATESGLIGLLIYALFLCAIFIKAFKKRKITKEYNFNKLTTYMIVLYVLLNITSAFMSTRLFWLFISLFFVYTKLEMTNKMADTRKEVNEKEGTVYYGTK